MPIIDGPYSELSSGAPSLVEWDNALYLGWAGAELTPAHHLNIIQSSDGVNFTNKKTLTDSTIGSEGPSLATFDNQLYVAFMGGENLCPEAASSGYICGYVHLGVYNHSEMLQKRVNVQINGVTQTTIARPTIAGFNGKLYIAWTGTDPAHHLNIASSSDGFHFGSHQVIEENFSFKSPYLTVFNNQLHVTFTGTGQGPSFGTGTISTAVFLDGNPRLQNQKDLGRGRRSDYEPATANFGGKLYLGWEGTDASTTTNLAFASDGLNFSNPPSHPSDHGSSSTGYGPGLGTFKGHLYYAWTAATGFFNLYPEIHVLRVA